MIREKYPVRSVLVVVMLAAVLTVGSGCIWTPELTRVKNDIENQIPNAHFEKEFSLSLGPLALGFARLATRFVPDTYDARDYLKDVRRVQVAVYNTTSMPPVGNVRVPERLSRMAELGWEVAVKVREENELVLVMYRVEDESVRDLYVVVLNTTELVIVKASGHLERLVARALREGDDIPGIPYIHDNRHKESTL